jgi:TonB-linked SusC/RagA family outer membrane protein
MKVLYPIKLCMLMFFTLITFTVAAQTGSISGKISDETNMAIPGATVEIVGTQMVVPTDANGNYKFANLASGTYTVSARYLGFAAQTLTATVAAGNVVLNFSLKPDLQNLSEVVVIGYGTAEKKSLTGSIATVNSKDFQKGTITTPEQLIQGKVAGVNIVNNGGRPGAGSVIRIRGGASLNASNDPLIVVDGIPFSGSSIGNAPNPLVLINPNDIETFTVLKDANATAIYGSRASNGVILITTKKGGSGAPVFNFSTNNSIATVIKNVDVLSADQIRSYVNANGTAAQKALLGTANTNWQDEIFQNAFSSDNNFSVGGAFQNVPYRFSAGYLNQQGLLITDKLTRASGALSISPSFFANHLKVELNLKGTLSESHFANDGAISSAIQFDPTQPVHANNKFGNYFEWIQGAVPNPNAPRNPVALIRLQDNNGKAARSFGNIKFDYSFHFLPELHANLNLGYDNNTGYGFTRVPSFAAQSASTSGFFGDRKNTESNIVSEFYLNYAKNVASINSRFDATLGYGYYDNVYTGYNFKTFKGTGELITTPVFPYSIEQNKLLSYYGRFVYTLADKYILSGTMRADASSKFSEDNRWGYFPSAGFTWRIIGEDFMRASNTFSDLKLRLSYGETGNKDGIGNYDYLSKYYANSNTGQYQIGGTFYNYYSPAAYDPDLKWETTTTYNAGLDYGFAKGRIFGSVDAYYKKTKDLLSTINIPVGTNFSNLLTTNVGNMEVRGIEGSINFAAIKSENTNWDFGFNVAYNKRKVTNLTLNPDPASKIGAGDIAGGTGTTLKYNSVNQVPGAFFVYKQVYNSNGAPLEGVYEDLNGDGIISTGDQYFYKSPDPTLTFGFNTNFNYKKWSINTVLRANIGNYAYENVSSNFGIRTNILSPSGIINNTGADFLNTNFQTNQFLSDYYIKNASFLKMDNIGISYNVGRLSKANNSTLRISANCQNVFVVTKFDGLDPELSSGIDYNLYPRPRTYTLGLNVGF